MVQLINETSQSFREGKKWKCNSSCGTRSPRSSKPTTFRDRLESTRQKQQSLNQCKCKLQIHNSSQCDSNAEVVEHNNIMMLNSAKTFDNYDSQRPQRPRQLVRQMATTTENSAENSSQCPLVGMTTAEDKRLRVNRGRMPSRQWTTDASFSENQNFLSNQHTTKANSTPVVMSSASNAFLLRPVSRNSTGKTMSGQGSGSAGGGAGGPTQTDTVNCTDVLDVKSPGAKAAIAAAVAAAKGGLGAPDIHSLGPEFRSACTTSNGTIHSRGMILRKQRTTESAPTSHLLMSAGGTLRQYPRLVFYFWFHL